MRQWDKGACLLSPVVFSVVPGPAAAACSELETLGQGSQLQGRLRAGLEQLSRWFWCLLQSEKHLSRQREGFLTPENLNVKKSTWEFHDFCFSLVLTRSYSKVGLMSLWLENRNKAHGTCASWIPEKFLAVLRLGQQARKLTYLSLNFCVEWFFFSTFELSLFCILNKTFWNNLNKRIKT